MKKRLLCFMLTVCFLVGLIPLTASATESAVVNSRDIKIGDYITLGRYYGEPIVWRCVDIDENGPLMLSDKIIAIKAFDANGSYTGEDGDNSHSRGNSSSHKRSIQGSNFWADSNIRAWLNSTDSAGNVTFPCGNLPQKDSLHGNVNAYAEESGFLSSGNFTEDELSYIKSVTQKTVVNEVDAQLATSGSEVHKFDFGIQSCAANYGTAYTIETTDRMFFLNCEQVSRVNENLSTYHLAYPSKAAVEHSEYKSDKLSADKLWFYWLRDANGGETAPTHVRHVSTDGNVYLSWAFDDIHIGIRPAFYLNSDGAISVVSPKAGVTLNKFTTSLSINIKGHYNLGSGKIFLKDWNDEIVQQIPITSETCYYNTDLDVTNISGCCENLPGNAQLYLYIENGAMVNADTGAPLAEFSSKGTWSFHTPKKVSKDVWGFENYESKVDLSVWLKLFGPAGTIMSIFDPNNLKGGNGGLCFGMAGTAMTFDQGYISYDDFDQDPVATSVSTLSKDARSNSLNLTAEEYIKLGYVMQFSPYFSVQNISNQTTGKESSGKLKDLYDAVKNYEESGKNPVCIDISGSGRHALWGYGIESHDDYESILIYDCNEINLETEIRLYGKYPNFTGWDYPTNSEFTSISYVLDCNLVYFLAKELQDQETQAASETDYLSEIQSSDYNLLATDLSDFTITKSGEISSYFEDTISGNENLILPIEAATALTDETANTVHEFWIESDSTMTAKNTGEETKYIALANNEYLLEFPAPVSGEIEASNAADTIKADIRAGTEENTQETIALSSLVNDEVLRLEVTGKLNGQCTAEQTDSGITISGMEIGQVTTSYKDEEVNKLENLSDAAISIQWRTKDGCTYVIITSDKNLDGVYETPLVSPILIDGTPAVIPPAQSESGNTVFSISVSPATGGVVAASPKSASKGSTVTITATPNTGYQLDKLTVTDKNGNNVKLTDYGDGTYTFTMPASKVSVAASFIALEVPAPSLPFTDVTASDWFYDAVAYVYDNGLMTGTSANAFSPNATTTRGMIVTILHRLEGTPTADASGFTDVEKGAWYQDAVDWAAANGIVNGTSQTTFAPNAPITREQMAAILYRYAAYKGYDVSQKAQLDQFQDQSAVSGYAEDALAWANAAGLITGVTDTTLSPKGSAVRAQTATILMRFCEGVAK